MPHQEFKFLSKSVKDEIKRGPKRDYIQERFSPSIVVPPDVKKRLDELDDFKFVDEILSKRFDHLEALMVSEMERRRSFRSTWQKYEDKVEGVELAKAGFYFLNNKDRVKCAFCSGIIENWEKGDEPMERHRRYFSFCKFVQGKSIENIPFDDAGPAHLLETVRGEQEKDTEDPRVVDGRSFQYLNPATPMYKHRSDRLRSYQTHWPPALLPLREKLCDAGFFNLREDPDKANSVECFHCGGTLEDWKVEENPWEEHAKWFFKCPFLITSKGRNWIESIREKMTPQDRHESENMAYKPLISTRNDRYMLIAQMKKEIKDSVSYEHSYKQLEKPYELIMRAHQANNWNVYEEPAELLQCIYAIQDGKIKPETELRKQAPPRPQLRARVEAMLEENLLEAIIHGQDLTEVQKLILDKEGCSWCNERRPGAFCRPCGCLALCNTCRLFKPLPDKCLVCYEPVEETWLANCENYYLILNT